MAESWAAWHDEYDDPASPLARRLAVVRAETRAAITRCAAGSVRLLSACAGQGRDVVAALVDHTRRPDVTAVLLEADAENCALARQRAEAAGLANVAVVRADAGLTDAYAGRVPADVLLFCGVFGHLPDTAIRRTVEHLLHLCGAGVSVIWTRHLGPPDGSANLTPAIRGWFREAGFAEVAFRYPAPGHGVGVHRLVAPPRRFVPGKRLFAFVARSGYPAPPPGPAGDGP